VEVFATLTLVGSFALLLAVGLFDSEIRGRLGSLIVPTCAAYLLAMTILSPYIFYFLRYGIPHELNWTPSRYSADIVGFLVPRETIWLGTTKVALAISRNFRGNILENGDYLGIALILFVEIFWRRYWRIQMGKFLAVLFLVIVIAAMGPAMQVAGRETLPMPWTIFVRLPLLSYILPVRLMMYAFLVMALMAAIWFTEWSASRMSQCAVAALIVISIAPNPSASFWVSRLDLPIFFAHGMYAKHLAPGEIIMPLPLSQEGNSMYWQLKSNMYFRMAGGWTGISPFEFDRMPIVNFLHGAIDLFEAGDQLKAYLARFDVRDVVVDPSAEHFKDWKSMLASLGTAPVDEGDIKLYRIPPGSLAAYANLPAEAVEARASALRFDAILEAAAKYLVDGHDPANLTPFELKRLGLLPHDWFIDTEPNAFSDWSVSQVSGSRIGIAIVGSYDGVKPLIHRYRGAVAEIFYPAPTRWTAESVPSKDLLKTLVLTFDTPHLEAAAAQLKSSPPPERTTSFIAAVSSWRSSSR
jgi:hypothetical protein